MKTAEIQLLEYANFEDVNGSEPISLLPLTIVDMLDEYAEQEAIGFAEWIAEEGWIRDPFPQKGFNDNLLRWTDIATIDIHSDDKLQMHTTSELFNLYKEIK